MSMRTELDRACRTAAVTVAGWHDGQRHTQTISFGPSLGCHRSGPSLPLMCGMLVCVLAAGGA